MYDQMYVMVFFATSTPKEHRIHHGSPALDESFSINLGEDFNPVYSKFCDL